MYDSKRIIAHPADGVALKERAAGRAKTTAHFRLHISCCPSTTLSGWWHGFRRARPCFPCKLTNQAV